MYFVFSNFFRAPSSTVLWETYQASSTLILMMTVKYLSAIPPKTIHRKH